MDTKEQYREYARRVLELERIFSNKENELKNLNEEEKYKTSRLLAELVVDKIIDQARWTQILDLLTGSDKYFIREKEGIKEFIKYQHEVGMLTKIETEKEIQCYMKELRKRIFYYNKFSNKEKQEMAFTQLYKVLTMQLYSSASPSVIGCIPFQNMIAEGLEGIIENFNEITKDGIKIKKHNVRSANEVGKLDTFSTLKDLTIIKKVPKKQGTKLEEEFRKAKLVYSTMEDISLTPKPILYLKQEDNDYLVFYKLPSCTAKEFMKKVDKTLISIIKKEKYLTKEESHEVKELIRRRYAETICRVAAESIARIQVKTGKFIEEKQENLPSFDFEFYYKDKIKPNLKGLSLTPEQEQELFKCLKGKSTVVTHRDLHPNNILIEEKNLVDNPEKEKYWLTSASIIDFELMSKSCSPIFDITTLMESNYSFRLSKEQKIKILNHFSKKVREYGGDLSDEDAERQYRSNAIFANLRLATVNSMSIKNSEDTASKSYKKEELLALQTAKELLEDRKNEKESKLETLFKEAEKIYLKSWGYARSVITRKEAYENFSADPKIMYEEKKERTGNLIKEYISNQLKTCKHRNKLDSIIKIIRCSSDKLGNPYTDGLYEDILEATKN